MLHWSTVAAFRVNGPLGPPDGVGENGDDASQAVELGQPDLQNTNARKQSVI